MLNKLDLLEPEQQAARVAEISAALHWTGPIFAISAATGEGAEALMQAVMVRLDELKPPPTAVEPPEELPASVDPPPVREPLDSLDPH